jgi:HTH-type transcriptional regulator / antitoxin MqsA
MTNRLIVKSGHRPTFQGRMAVTTPEYCLNCDSRTPLIRFENEAFSVDYAGISETVPHLSGSRCSACGEIEFDAESAESYGAAGDALIQRARAQQSQEIRRIRRKLGLTQAAAARLTGGGHNAFSRYERGETEPMPAVVNLLRLLDKHPALLQELL